MTKDGGTGETSADTEALDCNGDVIFRVEKIVLPKEYMNKYDDGYFDGNADV